MNQLNNCLNMFLCVKLMSTSLSLMYSINLPYNIYKTCVQQFLISKFVICVYCQLKWPIICCHVLYFHESFIHHKIFSFIFVFLKVYWPRMGSLMIFIKKLNCWCYLTNLRIRWSELTSLLYQTKEFASEWINLLY